MRGRYVRKQYHHIFTIEKVMKKEKSNSEDKLGIFTIIAYCCTLLTPICVIVFQVVDLPVYLRIIVIIIAFIGVGGWIHYYSKNKAPYYGRRW